jgi:hypothetical protein
MEIFIMSMLMLPALVTSIGCRRAETHGRRASWWLILLSTVVTVLLAMLYLGQADLFRPAQWDEHKGGTSAFWEPVIFASEVAAVIAVFTSLAVFLYFRTRHRDVKPIA